MFHSLKTLLVYKKKYKYRVNIFTITWCITNVSNLIELEWPLWLPQWWWWCPLLLCLLFDFWRLITIKSSSHCSLHEALRIWLGSFLEVSGWSLWLKLIESAIYHETKTELGTREKMITKPREVHCIYVMQQQHLSLSIDISSLIASLNAGSTKNKL